MLASSIATDGYSRRLIYLLVVLATIALTCLIYWGTLRSLVSLWSYFSYRHSFFVPIISMYLIWQDRANIPDEPMAGSNAGLICVGISMFVWLVGKVALVQALEHIALIAMLNSAVLAVGGWRHYRAIAFPLIYLLLAIPNGDSLISPLMVITADVATSLVNIAGVPVFREGMILFLPGGTFEVATVCSGLNYLNAGVAIGALIGRHLFRRIRHQLLFLVLLVFLLIVANGVRAGLTMLIASATEMRYMVGQDHVVLGWILFVAVFALLFYVGSTVSRRLEKRGLKKSATA